MVLKDYYRLAKPGIVYGNLITTSAGFFFASQGRVNSLLLLSLLSATTLVIASACVFNNIIDLDIDCKMPRTKIRPLVRKTISPKAAFLFGTILAISGFLVLAFFTNLLTFLAGLTGYIFYLGIYSYWKRKTVWGTLVGSVSGSTPPLAGYVAVVNHLDTAAAAIFLLLVFWQMAHFYAISIYRIEEYKKAKIPVWSRVKGVFSTKIQILFFTFLFGLTLILFKTLGFASYFFLLPTIIVFLFWLKMAIEGFATKNDKNWARRFFLFSQKVILTFSVFISIDAFFF